MRRRSPFVSGGAVLAAALTVLACSKDPTSPDTPSVICPLSVGNYWTFVDTVFYGGMTLVDSATVGITGKTVVEYEGESYDVHLWTWYDNETNEPRDYGWFIRNESDGLWELGGGGPYDTLIVRTQWLKFPASIGETWDKTRVTYSTSSETFQAADTVQVDCVATRERLATMAGTFFCYVYHYQKPSLLGEGGPWLPVPAAKTATCVSPPTSQLATSDVYLYFVPNLGYVRYVRKENGCVVRKFSLASYHLE